ncbi:MAG: hypothetical protein OXC11_00025 [Rhodospirillales bacterium]|nr:hypothetical protein [Rhodospirillales bacterium]
MTGLGVVYAKEPAEGRGWASVPDREKTGRLREVYWAHRAAGKLRTSAKPFVSASLKWTEDRGEIGRRRDEAGDEFVHLVETTSRRSEHRFEWLEVTEVFTAVPPSRIEGAMRAWNGIADRNPVDFDEFREGLRRGRASRMEQRKAADAVIDAVNKKLGKASYQNLLERYGYGTQVVGMPLWFAVPPDDPFRPENAVDDFVTRTKLGLKEVGRRTLRRRDCPFRNVLVMWEPTPQALREWNNGRSVEYQDAANMSFSKWMPASFWLGVLPDLIEQAVEKTGTPESEAPSRLFHVSEKKRKKARGKGPYPESVEAIGKAFRGRVENPTGLGAMLKWRLSLSLLKLLFFKRVYGTEGLKRMLARKYSISHVWRVSAVRRKQQGFYRESIRGGRAFGEPRGRDGWRRATCCGTRAGR